MESTDLIPLTGDIAKITKRAEEFKELHDALQRNLHVYLQLTMDTLAGVHQKIKSSVVPESTRQMVSINLIRPGLILSVLADTSQCQEEIKVPDGVCWDSEVQDVTRHLFVPRKARRRDRSIISFFPMPIYVYVFCTIVNIHKYVGKYFSLIVLILPGHHPQVVLRRLFDFVCETEQGRQFCLKEIIVSYMINSRPIASPIHRIHGTRECFVLAGRCPIN